MLINQYFHIYSLATLKNVLQFTGVMNYDSGARRVSTRDDGPKWKQLAFLESDGVILGRGA